MAFVAANMMWKGHFFHGVKMRRLKSNVFGKMDNKFDEISWKSSEITNIVAYQSLGYGEERNEVSPRDEEERGEDERCDLIGPA